MVKTQPFLLLVLKNEYACEHRVYVGGCVCVCETSVRKIYIQRIELDVFPLRLSIY